MPTTEFNVDIQGDWNPFPLREEWPRTLDNLYIFGRLETVPAEVTAVGARGKVLEVAAAEAGQSCRLSKVGFEAYALDPAPGMLLGARQRMAQESAHVTLVRGIAENLPFADHSFDRVLCNSALDHFADPEIGIREMARVVKADGRVVLTFVNYGGWTVRASRAVYRIGRFLRLIPPEAEKQKLFWDSPVPYEHTFESTMENIETMCRPYLTLESALGVSLGWNFPGWGRLIAFVPYFERFVPRLDEWVRHRAPLADFVVTTWRPRPLDQWPVDLYRVRRTNPVYQRLVRAEREYWSKANFDQFFRTANDTHVRLRNSSMTGDPQRSWVQDLSSRGPFRDVAILGCDDSGCEAEWLRIGGSERIDLFDLSGDVLAKVRDRMGPLAGHVRFVEADLNFVELPESSYDCIWASGALHCLTNLEHVYAQIERALRPGGIFAFNTYIGEPRLQYSAYRLERMNELFETIPRRFRHADRVERPDPPWHLSPFQAVRSQDVLPLALERFDVVHELRTARYFPLALLLDLPAVEREAPGVLERLRDAEAAACDDPAMIPCCAYMVLRKRG